MNRNEFHLKFGSKKPNINNYIFFKELFPLSFCQIYKAVLLRNFLLKVSGSNNLAPVPVKDTDTLSDLIYFFSKLFFVILPS